MNDAEKGKLVKSMVSSEKEKTANFLMVLVDLPAVYVSLITGVSVEEINRLKKVRH